MNLIIFEKINSLAFKWDLLDQVLIFGALYLPYILVILSFSLLIFNFKRYKFLPILSILSGSIALLFTLLFRALYYNPRPFVSIDSQFLLDHNDISSFPSGHTSFFFAFSTIIFLYNRKAGILFYILSFVIGLSRIATGLHWPIDILGGIILGSAVGFIVWHYANKRILLCK